MVYWGEGHLKSHLRALSLRALSLSALSLSALSLSACDLTALEGGAGGAGADEGERVIAAALPELTREELLDPARCQPCHPNHYREWSMSMHAYASEDPVFIALNQRGQRETDGALGAFCVQCHAPIATRLGLTTDGLNLTSVPDYARGVTCAFCHQVSEITGAHNNQLTWADDGLIRGPLKRLNGDSPHRSQYSPHLDRRSLESSALCGSCHDIVTPSGLHLERTYWEWSQTLFNDPNPRFRNTCNDCHMPRVSAGEGRSYSSHLMPAVDVHLTEHPGRALQREAVEDELSYTLLTELCVIVSELGGAEIELTLENISAGHRFPSGAALDRRVWVELTAWSAENELLWEQGLGPSELPVSEWGEDIWLLRDQAFDASGAPSHYFWELTDVSRASLPGPPPQGQGEDTHITRAYRFGTEEVVARVDVRVWMRPIGLELLRDLVNSADLAEGYLSMMPTLELQGAAKSWTLELATPATSRSGRQMLCL